MFAQYAVSPHCRRQHQPRHGDAQQRLHRVGLAQRTADREQHLHVAAAGRAHSKRQKQKQSAMPTSSW